MSNFIEDKTDVLIIGGSNVGVSAATRIRRLSELSDITIIESSSFVGSNQAALPYFISGAIPSIDSIIAGVEDTLTNIYDINIMKNYTVTKIDKKNKLVYGENLDTMQTIKLKYDKLVIASGFKYNLEDDTMLRCMNFFMLKNLEDAIKIRKFITDRAVRNIAIIGSNYISLKMASALIEAGFDVTIIDNKTTLLDEFDDDFNSILKNEITKSGGKVLLNVNIENYRKNINKHITSINIGPMDLPVDMILYFDNIEPNTDIAIKSDIKVSGDKSIIVDNKFCTSDESIWAGGAAIQMPDFVTEDKVNKFSINQANLHGRSIASSIFDINNCYSPNIRSYFFKLKNFSIGIAGINEIQAKNNKFDYIVAEVFTGDHERFISNASQLHLKILVDKNTRKILGGQVSGKGSGVDKKMDVLITAILGGLTVDQLSEFNLSYNPDINLIVDPINVVAMIAQNILNGISTPVYSKDVVTDKNALILDIRTKNERDKMRVVDSLWIPLDELRNRLSEVPKDKKIFVYGHVGMRGYIAERILKGCGYKDVYNILGGISSIKINENID